MFPVKKLVFAPAFSYFLHGMRPKLRIIIDGARSAAFNMAADLFLLGRAALENSVFVRFYSWERPSISLGCMQKAGELLDRINIEREGADVVTRPTGGRAVLHWNDITYSCVFPAKAPGMGISINESYRVVGRCLMRGLSNAGIACESHDSSHEYNATRSQIKLPCFLSPNRNEIMVQGRKLVGSAQKRTHEAVLQHGSIPMDGSFCRLPDFLLLSEEEREKQKELLKKKCICIQEIDPGMNVEDLVSCLKKGFVETLHGEAVEQFWSETEIKKTQEMIV